MPYKNGPRLLSCGHKHCHACHKPKPLAEFYKNRSKPDGYTSQCRDCAKAGAAAVRDRRGLLQSVLERSKDRGATGLRLVDLVDLDELALDLAQ